MDTLGNALQALRAMINRIHTCDNGQQNLCGTDVRCGLLSTNMLLACLQCQSVGRFAIGILRKTNQTTGQASFERLSSRHITGVRAAKT